MHPVFYNDEFKHFAEYVEEVWRPATECGVITTQSSTIFPLLEQWFGEYVEDTISIGPYVDIKPYGGPFELEAKTKAGETMIEFLFLYEDIDKTKLSATQLSLGRADYVDIEGTERIH